MKSAWVTSSASVNKPWGEETCWNSQGEVTVKTITLKKGQRNSFKYNDIKSELLICASGTIRAYFADEELIKNDIGDLKTAVLKEKMALFSTIWVSLSSRSNRRFNNFRSLFLFTRTKRHQ